MTRKPTKKPPQEADTAAMESGEVLPSQIAEIEALLGLQLAELEELQRNQTERREAAHRKSIGTHDSDKTTTEHKDEAKAAAEDIVATKAITEAIAKASHEVRMLEKHKRAIISQLTPDLEDEIIEDFLRDLSRTRREKFVRLLASLEDTNDLLSL